MQFRIFNPETGRFGRTHQMKDSAFYELIDNLPAVVHQRHYGSFGGEGWRIRYEVPGSMGYGTIRTNGVETTVELEDGRVLNAANLQKIVGFDEQIRHLVVEVLDGFKPVIKSQGFSDLFHGNGLRKSPKESKVAVKF